MVTRDLLKLAQEKSPLLRRDNKDNLRVQQEEAPIRQDSGRALVLSLSLSTQLLQPSASPSFLPYKGRSPSASDSPQTHLVLQTHHAKRTDSNLWYKQRNPSLS